MEEKSESIGCDAKATTIVEGENVTTKTVSDPLPPVTPEATPKSTLAPVPTTNQFECDAKVKSQYILSEAHPTLAQPESTNKAAAAPGESTGNGDKKEDERSNGSNRNQRQKGGRNRRNAKNTRRAKRPRDDKSSPLDKVCRSILIGVECPYGKDKCKYNHDLKEVLRLRPDDIKEVDTGCPFYNLRGLCPYGISCRVGSSHLNLATGVNLQRDASELTCPLATDTNPDTANCISRDVQASLRKKTYKFVCKRHFEKNNNGTEKDSPATATPVPTNVATPVDQSPYPTKTRKLIDFSNKVYVAPLTTVGNLPFRRILKRYGADITCGEMAVAKNLLEGKTGEWALLKRHSEEDVFGIQIAAGHADVFTRISEVIENEGIRVDFLDLNLGCPIDLICDHGSGAKLMLRDGKLKESVLGMTKVLSCPITIKMRTGWDEKKPFAHKLVPKIQKWGIDGIAAIMVHGRSRLQRYHKLADWNYIEKVATSQDPNLPALPVIGNGDIFSYTDYERHVLENDNLSKTAMLARGALIKPWLPTEIKERRHWDISASERFDMLKDFVKCGLEHWGSDQKGVDNTRRFLLEWLSFLYRYIPVGLLEVLPQEMNQRPPNHMCGRNDLETLMLSKNCADWIKISEMLLGPVPEGFYFEPKHKANAYK